MTFWERLRRRTNDRGFVMMSAVALLALLSASVLAHLTTTNLTITGSKLSRDFTEAGQAADQAVQDAIWYLNENPGAVLPDESAPATGTPDTSPDAHWAWYAETATDGRTVIHAEGTFRSSTRAVQATAGSLNVGGFSSDGSQITYEASPATAFSHTLLGRDVTVSNGTATGAGQVFLSGTAGALSSALNVDPETAGALTDARIMLYGKDAAAKAGNAGSNVPVGLELDPQFITENMSRCGTSVNHWVASSHGGILVANGNVGCYTSMTFDVDTVVLGSGAFNAFVATDVIFSAGVTGAALNIYTGGNTEFRTEAAPGSSLSLSETFIYAPQGRCATVPYRSMTKPLEFNGSLACDSIEAAGTFTHAAPVDPLGDDIYDSTVWYLVEYRQAEGSRA